MNFDRKITVALLFAIALESASIFLWAGAAAERLTSVESQLEQQPPLRERMARIETEMIAARRQLDRIERHLEQASKRLK